MSRHPKITMQAPHLIARDLFRLLASGQMNDAIVKTLTNTLIALFMALTIGVAAGALIHRWRGLRDTLDPLFATYYAVPVFAFYPFFIVVFGLGDLPQILIAFMLGVVAMIVNTLNGLDRVPPVLLKTARIMRFGPMDTEFHGRPQVLLASREGHSAKPSWCFDTITTYFAPALWMMSAHWSASNISARNCGAKSGYWKSLP